MTDLDRNFAAREVVCWACLRRVVAPIAKTVATIAKASGLLIQHQGQFLCKEACPIKLVTKCSLIKQLFSATFLKEKKIGSPLTYLLLPVRHLLASGSLDCVAKPTLLNINISYINLTPSSTAEIKERLTYYWLVLLVGWLEAGLFCRLLYHYPVS